MHRSVVLFGIVLVFAVLGLGLFLQVNVAAYLSAASHATPTPSNSYDPAYYGLPPTIAGYKVLAVETSDNTACVPVGSEIVVLQSTQPYTVEESLSYSGAEDAAIKADLDKRGFGASEKVSWAIVGPGVSRDQVISEIQSWNKQRWTYGCVTSGPAPMPAH